jgi:hypothetical protein
LYWLDDGGDDDDIPLLPIQNPTSAFGKRDVGATSRIPKRSSTTAALSVTSVMSSTSGRVNSAPP